MSRIILVSADGHASARLEAYRPYLESKYHEALDEEIAYTQFLLDSIPMRSAVEGLDPETAAVVDDAGAIRSGGAVGAHDPKRRLEEMDREGVVVEIVNADSTDSQSFCVKPFCWPGSKLSPVELREAGARAYNRWLADMLAETDGRVLGVAEAGTCLDLDATVRDLEWAASHGFASVHAPGQMFDPNLPRLYDSAYFERFWAACVDLGLVVNSHAGWGTACNDLPRVMQDMPGNFKGVGPRISKIMIENLKATKSSYIDQLVLAGATIGETSPQSREPLWQLMLGGVFDRHPALKLSLTELRADWVPATLAALDERVAQGGTPLRLTPSEYFERNCRVTPSFPHPAEMALRHDIGVDHIMFGRDYPHPEGTWPNTWDWIRVSYAGVPEDEARLMLGENAISWYGLDRERLAALAEKIGPRAEDLLGDYDVDERKIDSFDSRGGFRKPAENVNSEAVVQAFENDLALAQAPR